MHWGSAGSLPEDIVGCLVDGLCVTVVGARGSGRSYTTHRVTELLADAGIGVVSVPGVRALRDRPLAAISAAAPDLVRVGETPTVAMVAGRLAERLSAHRAVLVVDDVEDLDDLSAGLFAATRRRVGFAVLCTQRPARGVPSVNLTSAAELQPGVRFDLDPLTFGQIHDLVHQLLPGAVDPSAVARIATHSGGLPAFVRAIVDLGRRAGTLTQRDGLWSAREDLWTPSLAHTIEPMLADLDPTERDALTDLALAGTSDVAVARAIVATPLLARLDDARLIETVPSRHTTAIGVFPPLVGEYLRRSTSRARRMLLSERVMERGGPIRVAGDFDGAQAKTSASALSQRVAEYWQAAAEAAQQVWRESPTAANAVLLLEAMTAASATPEAIAQVRARTIRSHGDERSWAMLAYWWATHLAIRLGETGAARDHLQQARQELQGWDGFLRAVQGHIDFMVDRVPEESATQAAAPGDDPMNESALEAVRIEIDLAGGHVQDAIERLDAYRPTARRLVRDAEVYRGLALVLGGDVDEAVTWARARLTVQQDELDPGAMHAHAYVAALGLALSGRFEEFDELADVALTLTAEDPAQRHYRAGVLSLASIVAGWQGRSRYARALAVQARGLDHRAGPFPAMVPGTLLTITRSGHQADAANELWQTAHDRFDRGYIAAGVVAAVASIERLPDPDRAHTLTAAVATSDSALLRAFAHYCEAATARDVDELSAAARELDAAGTALYALRALATRSLVLREQGRRSEAALQADEAWQRARMMGPERHGLFELLARDVDLSAREIEVAELSAGGITVPEVAKALGLSIRTAEHHVHNAKRKVGVDSREGLVRAVTTWLSPREP
jgi:DNA-binding CsgD family transcriptional regulator